MTKKFVGIVLIVIFAGVNKLGVKSSKERFKYYDFSFISALQYTRTWGR